MNVYILNLKRQWKRRILCQGGLLGAGTPFEKIKIWVANDDRDYNTTYDVVEAAIADGFPKFQEYLVDDRHKSCSIALMAQMWNYCRFWQHLIDQDETAILIQDDRRFGCFYQELLDIHNLLVDFDPDFEFLSLWCQIAVAKKSFSFRMPFNILPIHQHLAFGLYESADTGFIVTPKACHLLIESAIGFMPARTEYAISARCMKNKHWYSYIDETKNVKHLAPSSFIPSVVFNDE